MRRRPLGIGVLLLLWLAAPVHAALMAPPLGATDYLLLRGALIERIPEYAPGWTDHNTHDPGATLLELFAFTLEDLAFQVALDVPAELLWADYDAEQESTLDALAYLLLDAAFLARHGNDVREQDWLEREGIDPAWSYSELRSAAVLSVPEPAPVVLLATGLLAVALRGRRFRRRADPSPATRA